LLAAIEAPQLATDPRFSTRLARIDNYTELGRELDSLFSRRSVDEWVERLGKNDVPFAPINRVDAVVKDPQVKHLGLMVPIDNPHTATQSVRPAVQFDGQRASSVRAAPMINEHGAAIRAALSKSPSWPMES
jgi:crotonobetainyl-CoA:carnitine CoA-transferase CaiB-like acyl-CoA transferase